MKKKLEEFYQKLTDGTIENQKPDGQEMVDSMKRAKITSPGVIEWSEMCFCPTPLNHERITVYDHYLRNLETRAIDNYIESYGKSFFEFLEKQFQR